jgi:FkbM family methyltransferase
MKILVILFIYIHYLLNKAGIKIRGLGKVQKLLKHEYVFTIMGKKFLFFPGIEGSYDYLLIKKSNEPETVTLFSRIFPKLGDSNFVDVGASVGEFVTYASCFENIRNIYAFEPRPDCAEVIRKNAMLNKDERIIVIENALSNCHEQIPFFYNEGGTSSGFFRTQESQSTQFTATTVTMDSVIDMELKNTVLLVDVEGAEPNVLRGAKKFIEKNSPLIVFEYNNQISKKYFHLDDIKEILGANYHFYRLNKNGNLDGDFLNTWNCVAIPQNSIFSLILQSSIVIN